MATPSPEIGARLDLLLQNATSDAQHVPGVALEAVDFHGKTIYSGTAGTRGLGSAEPISTDTVFWIASCTKLISAVALMILVERGEADLDSADLLEDVVPELKTVQILNNGSLRPKKNRITLRMLMTHTAGLSYSFYNEGLWKDHFHQDPTKDEFQGDIAGIQQPLIFEPGTSHDYSVGIDWAGIFISRRTKTTLEAFYHANIFQPLGMASTSFVPSADMRSRMAIFHQRAERLIAVPHFYRPARDDGPDYFQSAGAGLLSTVKDYSRVLAMLLNDGLSPHTKKRVLTHETVDQMFTNQIPNYTEKYVTGPPHVVSRPDLCVPGDPAAEPLQVTETYGWGITMLLQARPRAAAGEGAFAKGSATGLCNCFWSADREKGVAVACFSQILPFGDPHVYTLWQAVDAAIQETAPVR